MSFFDFYEQQTFKDLVNSDDVYVDKTGQICELYRNHNTFELLARPLGFGKTMLIDTITNLFRHKYPSFFADLAVANSDVKFPEQKVMRLDFSLNNATLGSTLPDYLANYFRTRAFENGLRTEINRDDNVYWQTVAYVKSLAEVSPSGKVVILIDNYDYPILKNLFKPAASSYYQSLLEFLRALSDNEEYIDWCLITGETKFYLSQDGQEGLCYIKDLTFEGSSTHICGFTEGEMRNYFNDFLQDEAECAGMTTEEFLSKLFDWYGNYRLTEQNIRVMRPESICKFLNLRDQNEYRSFYDASHVETVLETILTKYSRSAERLLMPNSCGYNFCEYSNLNSVRPFALLFQLGFFSLDHIDIDISCTPPTYGYYSKFSNREMQEFYQNTVKKLNLPDPQPSANKNRRRIQTEPDNA